MHIKCARLYSGKLYKIYLVLCSLTLYGYSLSELQYTQENLIFNNIYPVLGAKNEHFCFENSTGEIKIY